MSDFPNAGNLTLTIREIKCLMPTSTYTRSDQDAMSAVQKVLEAAGHTFDLAADVVDCFGPEAEPVAAALEIAGALTEVGDGIISLLEWIDKEIREDGGEPDDFYITKTPYSNTKPYFVDGSNPNGSTSWVLYPMAGIAPKESGATIKVNKDYDIVPAFGFDFNNLGEGSAVVFWDWESSKDDRVLLTLPVSSANIGNYQKTIYNAYYDCTYYVEYSIWAQ